MTNTMSTDSNHSSHLPQILTEQETKTYKLKLLSGPASVVNTAIPGKGATIDRMIQVHAPDQKAPWVVRATNSPVEVISFDVPSALAGVWSVSITPLPKKPGHAAALVEPSKLEVAVAFESGEKRELRFVTEVVNRLIRDLIAAFKPELVLDTRDCHVAYTSDDTRKKQKLLDQAHLTFKKGPWQVELSDIRSTVLEVSIEEANARYPGGFIRARVVFEEQGTEVKISWAPDAEASGLVLTATIGLAVRDGSLTYEDVAISLPIRLNFNFVPDALVDALVGYSKRVRTMLESKLMELTETSRGTLQKYIDAAIGKYVPNARIVGVTVIGGALVINYTEE